MTTIDKSGESLEKIIKDFRNEYKIHDWELQYEILKKPQKGFLGCLPIRLLSCVFNYLLLWIELSSLSKTCWKK